LENLLTSIGGQLNDEVVDRLMQVADANQDGQIQFEEFIAAMEGLL
jgi:Ca2+-binding EF-hand superfamily protein